MAGAARCRPRTGRAGEGEGGGGADQVGAGCADGTQPFLPTPLEFPKVAAEEMLSFLSSKEERLTEAGSHSTSRHAGADDGGVHGPLPGGAVREGEVFKAPIVVTGECRTGLREQWRREDAWNRTPLGFGASRSSIHRHG